MRYLPILVLAGCFRDAPAPAQPPAATHTCASASAKAAEILGSKELAAAFERTCNADTWSAEALACIDGATTHEAMRQCAHDHLTAEQMHHVADAAQASHHDGAGSGDQLVVTAIEPLLGDADGGTYVRIRGAAFIANGPRNVKVYFGSRQGAVVRFVSDTELIVEAPGGKHGEVVDVLCIFEPGGELKLPMQFGFK